jgi:translation initiation factor 3 subunit B
MFVEFRNADDAMFALQAMNNFPFDTKHTFKINKFTDIESFADMDETYEEPEPEEYQPRVICLPCAHRPYISQYLQEHLKSWLADPQGRDQYVMYRGDELQVNWHGKPSQCEEAHTRNVRTKDPIQETII